MPNPNQPIYERRKNGTSIGGGDHANVVQYLSPQGQSTGSEIEYIPSGPDAGAFKINTVGIYSISVTAEMVLRFASVPDCFICSDLEVSNTATEANQLARMGHNGENDTWVTQVSWTGYINGGRKVWVLMSSPPNSSIKDNQISITKVG